VYTGSATSWSVLKEAGGRRYAREKKRRNQRGDGRERGEAPLEKEEERKKKRNERKSSRLDWWK